MKKILLYLFLAFSFSFASELQECKALKLSETKDIVSCPHGTFEVTYELRQGKRNKKGEVDIKLLAEAKAPIFVKER